MVFEYDPAKSAANKVKHGIDFDEAQALSEDFARVEIPARTEDEPRILVIGRIAGRHGSAVVTPQGPNVRILSVRRARQQEVGIYESP